MAEALPCWGEPNEIHAPEGELTSYAEIELGQEPILARFGINNSYSDVVNLRVGKGSIARHRDSRSICRFSSAGTQPCDI